MSHSPNTKYMPSFDDPVDPSQLGGQNDSRYLAWLELNPEGSFDEWRKLAFGELDIDLTKKH